ncbi:hypothetical protein AWZ03_006242 [Drosophila navojoa]|uniref:Uncharacterized protein n=1 Tax=Drosophila navojoa TaxID=7232 RepID=A0A484BF43_DRONA|nr:hypothetical protein AWZ03_006242 [Drosophila navojoa]
MLWHARATATNNTSSSSSNSNTNQQQLQHQTATANNSNTNYQISRSICAVTAWQHLPPTTFLSELLWWGKREQLDDVAMSPGAAGVDAATKNTLPTDAAHSNELHVDVRKQKQQQQQRQQLTTCGTQNRVEPAAVTTTLRSKFGFCVHFVNVLELKMLLLLRLLMLLLPLIILQLGNVASKKVFGRNAPGPALSCFAVYQTAL